MMRIRTFFFAAGFFAACSCILPGPGFADDAAKQVVGTWKLVSEATTLEGGDKLELFGQNPKGRLVLTPDGHWFAIITRADRSPAKTSDEKAALLDSMLAYSGKYTIDGNKVTTRVDVTHNEVFRGALQNQTRFFSVEGDELTLRTGLIASSARPGQRLESVLIWQRER
jgi:Lipocalin-like domain